MRFFSSRLIVFLSAATPLRSFAESVDKETASNLPSLESRIQGAFFGSLVADALCLGTHYEYDAVKIHRAYGGKPMEKYMAPGEQMGGQTHGVGWGARNYHKGTVAGDQTDYGEYNVLILEHLAKISPQPFTVEGLLPDWQARITSNWNQWICTQTKLTMQQVAAGTPAGQLGGNSNAMALRYASMFGYTADEAELVNYAHQTMFTHRERTAHLGNEFFARVTYRIIHHQQTPREAIDSVVRDMDDRWLTQKVRQAIEKVQEATDAGSSLGKEGGEFVDDLALTSMARLWDVGRSEPIKVGKASPTEGTLPGAVYFILKYGPDGASKGDAVEEGNGVGGEKGLMAASKANSMVGGDNASRAVAIGMVLGAYYGVDAIEERPWREGLRHWEHCKGLLRKLPLLQAAAQAGSGKGGEEL